jgi:hypothetical protein
MAPGAGASSLVSEPAQGGAHGVRGLLSLLLVDRTTAAGAEAVLPHVPAVERGLAAQAHPKRLRPASRTSRRMPLPDAGVELTARLGTQRHEVFSRA